MQEPGTRTLSSLTTVLGKLGYPSSETCVAARMGSRETCKAQPPRAGSAGTGPYVPCFMIHTLQASVHHIANLPFKAVQRRAVCIILSMRTVLASWQSATMPLFAARVPTMLSRPRNCFYNYTLCSKHGVEVAIDTRYHGVPCRPCSDLMASHSWGTKSKHNYGARAIQLSNMSFL